MSERQLTRLVRPFPTSVINDNPSGYGTYVAHPVVEQRILHVLGPVSFEIEQILRGDTRDGKYVNVVVGCLARLTATIDGQQVTVVEVGDCEAPGNWPHDGARLKDAASDAYKRCAMRIGVGLHLWGGKDFHLYDALRKRDGAPGEES